MTSAALVGNGPTARYLYRSQSAACLQNNNHAKKPSSLTSVGSSCISSASSAHQPELTPASDNSTLSSGFATEIRRRSLKSSNKSTSRSPTKGDYSPRGKKGSLSQTRSPTTGRLGGNSSNNSDDRLSQRLGESWRTASTQPVANHTVGAYVSPSKNSRRSQSEVRRFLSIPAPPVLRNHADHPDGSDEDTSLEESWRENPEKRKVLMNNGQGPGSTHQNNHLTRIHSLHQHISSQHQDEDDHPHRPRSSSVSAGYNRDSTNRSKPIESTPSVASGGSLGSGSAAPTSTKSLPGQGVTFAESPGSQDPRLLYHGGLSPNRTPTKSSPIAWQRKSRSGGRRRGGRRRLHDEDEVSSPSPSSTPTKTRESPRRTQSNTFGNDSLLSSGILNTFLEQHTGGEEIPIQSLHTISCDTRSAHLSIALSDADGKTKTYAIGEREARMIEQLLKASTDGNESEIADDELLSPASQSEHWKPPQAGLVSPSGHATYTTLESDIAESARISTRSSTMVELSPPPFEMRAKPDLQAFMDRRRGKNRITSAFTVAGDRISTKFQGKSTEELLHIIKSEKGNTQSLHSPKKSAHSLSVSKEAHPAHTALNKLAPTPSMESLGAMHLSMPLRDSEEVDEDIDSQTDQITKHANGQDRQSYMDRRSSRSRRSGGSPSASGRDSGQRRKYRHRSASAGRVGSKHRPTPETPRRGQRDNIVAQLNASTGESAKELALEGFRPPSSVRPTNRRSMMRKMQSVPILLDGERDPSPHNGRKSQSPVRGRQQSGSRRSRSSTGRRHSPSATNGSRRARKRNTLEEGEEESLELDGLKNRKSFLDKFLDGDVDANDSASNLQSPSSARKYKASLKGEPENMEDSHRLDAIASKSARRESRKIKATGAVAPSDALKGLYVDLSLPTKTKSPKKKDTPTKKVKTCATKKKKKHNGKPKEETSPDRKVRTPRKAISLAVTTVSEDSSGGDKVTLNDLPRNREDKSKSLHPPKAACIRGLTKQRSCPNMVDREINSTHQRMLTKRLNSLTRTNSTSPEVATAGPEEEAKSSKRRGSRRSGPTTPRKPSKSPSRRSVRTDTDKPDTPVAAPSRALRPGRSKRHLSFASPTSDGSTKQRSDPKAPKSPHTRTASGPPRLDLAFGSSTAAQIADLPAPGQDAGEVRHFVLSKSLSSNPIPTKTLTPKVRRGGRLPPVQIAEGAILELDDNDTVTSDITNNFTVETWEVEHTKATRWQENPPGMKKIHEMDSVPSKASQMMAHNNGYGGQYGETWVNLEGTNWPSGGDQSFDRRKHLMKRWQSQPNMPSAGNPKTPTRRLDGSPYSTATRKDKNRLGWFKKVFKKKNLEISDLDSAH